VKVYELIQTLCQQDPNTEVLISISGYPIVKGDAIPTGRVYNYTVWHGGDDVSDPEFPKAVVLTTSEVDYEGATQKAKARRARAK
jgi:hypothetical protein